MATTLRMPAAARTSVASFEEFLAAKSKPGNPPSLNDHLTAIQELGARMRFSRNETVFNQGDAADRVYKIVDGTVRLCRYMPDGRRCVVDFLMPGELMGFVESPTQPVCAEAVTEVYVISYPRVCFDRIARENDAMRSQLLSHLSANLQTAHEHLFVMGCQKAKERVASFLLRLADRLEICCGDRMELPMSRQDIADHLGLTIETVSRNITILRSEGLVLVPNPHQIILQDIDGLRALTLEG